jgi:hypothetical protein
MPNSYHPESSNEPWYYRFASGYTNMVAWFSVGLTLLVLGAIDSLCLWAFVALPLNVSRLPLVVGAVIVNLGFLLVVLGILFVTALYLIFVDMGRQLRRLNSVDRNEGEGEFPHMGGAAHSPQRDWGRDPVHHCGRLAAPTRGVRGAAHVCP